jgi:hypothetical protein
MRKKFAEERTQNIYNAGYNQALKDIEKQVEESVIEKSNGEVTIEDLVAYNQGFKTGRDLAFQDFLEKAEKILTERMYFSDDEAKQFKNYMQNE